MHGDMELLRRGQLSEPVRREGKREMVEVGHEMRRRQERDSALELLAANAERGETVFQRIRGGEGPLKA